jgi:alpha-D-ribose 1-methylphosphonate 5-triphosphate diphosphatase PhnM
MATRETLLEAMQLTTDSDTARWMIERGVALADEETMSQAIHTVYCGIAADHDQPSEKDHQQALAMIAALQKYAESRPPA